MKVVCPCLVDESNLIEEIGVRTVTFLCYFKGVSGLKLKGFTHLSDKISVNLGKTKH
ncbi:hypothetical protein L8106_25877 [Lyngbya sp. PCC 8106]|nr:hypothetical protein L8106_25877 [Lyngbya sp. PCC 8106]